MRRLLFAFVVLVPAALQPTPAEALWYAHHADAFGTVPPLCGSWAGCTFTATVPCLLTSVPLDGGGPAAAGHPCTLTVSATVVFDVPSACEGAGFGTVTLRSLGVYLESTTALFVVAGGTAAWNGVSPVNPGTIPFRQVSTTGTVVVGCNTTFTGVMAGEFTSATP